MMSSDVKNKFRELQQFITSALETWDGEAVFAEDAWDRKEGGGGFTRTIANGRIIEKGGVAFSAVEGEVTKMMREQLKLDGERFFATGVSIVLHPKHPRHPIIHMNIRYFEMDSKIYWFGGGIDLTPHYIVDELATSFHQHLKRICDGYNPNYYDSFKAWADDYFFLPHRDETRGIGGIFFDNLTENDLISKEQILSMCLELGTAFPTIYKGQVDGFKVSEYTTQEKHWQNIRRSRYVEFNLLHDRGTKFGIYTNGRTESILLSMPPSAEWLYNYIPSENSEEEETLNKLRKGINYAKGVT
jgi:coproporphyrinogen III oxidase